MTPERAASTFIGVFVAIQLLLPLRWYLFADDVRDTRFAWRMFAAEDAIVCAGGFTEDGVPVDLSARFARNWNESVWKGRRDVVKAMLASECADRPGLEVHLRCKRVDGEHRIDGVCP